MPIIEGQASGRIVITSNISPMKDVAGDGAILIDPFDDKSIKKAYLAVIKDQNLRENIIQKGFSNAKKYTIKTIKNQYYNIYKTIQ